jgi:phytoene dehydrogenase-like protein
MPEEYDVVFIGAGHNGLTCASYLAKAGLKVILFERRHNIGGGAFTEEVTLPGFKHNCHSQFHGWIKAGPVFDDLELDKYGVKYIYPEIQWSIVFRDGRAMLFYQDVDKTCKAIEKFSIKDAKTYKEMNKKWGYLRDVFVSAFYAPPLPLSQQYAPFEGTEEGLELLRIIQSSPLSVCNELFESEEIKTWIMGMTTQIANPQNMFGTGVYIPVMFSLMHTKPWGICIGGSRNLAEGMARFLEDHGGKIVKNTHVSKIIIEGDRATGVQLEDGTEVKAKKAVVSNTHPIMTFIDMIGEDRLDPELVKKVKRFKGDDVCLFGVYLALNDPPDWKAKEKHPEIMQSFGVWFGHENTRELATQFSDIEEGELPRMPGGIVACPTIFDPTQAPPGKHTIYSLQFTAYELKGGSKRWDEVKKEVGDRFLDVWNDYAPNISSTHPNVLGRFYYSPLDIEREIVSMYKGSMMLGATSPDQMGIFRPFPNIKPYRAPDIEGLYMCGGHNHPMGGITGAPGYNCANAIADDFKIKKWWKLFKPMLHK